ncbi:hypothetical protein IVB45_17565 [Bradyrhizobium sp. 4]|uniref:hypothetical protein n=1 Tax=unclassified Bradyrhizobium TaxID=2631580 RepID=UPI001FF8EEE1|nr:MULTISPECIES: hypothetical protein [unclassified Bradyrhizobium]MCK1402016.1 hypothetical protein [Bradyrhizobium sp. 39]MCK1751264.1 hypothetical protein [Bradyrhizobium sp. 135]UPJ38517.1 hypothetical protein IVB45_17565 [Bradyrhizobium sp. 4]
MAFVPPKDRVLEQSSSNSQTVFTVTGALDLSYNAFSAAMSVGDTTIGAVVEPGVAFKAGMLTYSATNEVTVSSAFDSKGTFSSGGIKQVFMGLPAGSAPSLDGPQTLTDAKRAQGRVNLGVGTATRAITGASDTLVASDFAKLIKLNRSSAIALTATAAATLGDGWYCDIINVNTGIVTFDPNGAETVDAAATALIYQSESMRIWCDGTGFYTTSHAGDWVAFAPTLGASGGGSFGSASAAARFKKIRTSVQIEMSVTITTVGSATGNVQATLPVSSSVGALLQELSGAETAVNGASCRALIAGNSSNCAFGYYNNTSTATVAGALYVVTGIYEVGK